MTLQLAPSPARLLRRSGARAAPRIRFGTGQQSPLQFGVDNSFSGKMIKAATGTTTGGQPINLNETTFDDVYGRIGMLKIGAWYRTSPRTETVAGFVGRISLLQTDATNVGTVGTNPQIPLDVNFTSYSYWGFEGGQRLYFTRVRCHALCGLSGGNQRYGDIRGHVRWCAGQRDARTRRPGRQVLRESWAFSLGPTAGMLVRRWAVRGHGEFAAAFYQGGLSDVDWLVEEGLKDINSDSSRWSFPFVSAPDFDSENLPQSQRGSRLSRCRHAAPRAAGRLELRTACDRWPSAALRPLTDSPNKLSSPATGTTHPERHEPSSGDVEVEADLLLHGGGTKSHSR